jgi:hypothetical protein
VFADANIATSVEFGFSRKFVFVFVFGFACFVDKWPVINGPLACALHSILLHCHLKTDANDKK